MYMQAVAAVRRVAFDHPDNGQRTNVNDHLYAIVRALYEGIAGLDPNRVMAIKIVRVEYKLGLKEAKDLCDLIAEYQ